MDAHEWEHEEGVTGAMATSTVLPTTDSRALLIVARTEPDLFEALRQELADCPGIEVMLDRRIGDRRQSGQAVEVERRHRERRRLPKWEQDLRVRRYMLTRPRHRRPSD